MRNSNEKSLKEVIGELVSTYKLKAKLGEVRIAESWEKVMGKVIANRTSELFVRNKTLFVKINSAPLKSEMHFSKANIIKMLNDEVGDQVINEIVLL